MSLSRRSDRCASACSRTRSSRTSRTPSRSSVLLLTVALALAWGAAAQLPAALTAVSTRDQKVVRRWNLPGDPRGVAIGADGTIYAGLAQPQAVLAINPDSGAVRKRLVLDSEEIASTKELVTLRTDASRTKLYIANGSDESATILSLPGLAVLREITMEGEPIRDVVPDPLGRYIYVLGRRIHVFDKNGATRLRTLPNAEPMAIAVSSTGVLAVVASEDYGTATATSVALIDPSNWTELARDPLQTEATIEAAMFSPGDKALIAFSRDHMFEQPLTVSRPPAAATLRQADGTFRMRASFGDVVSSTRLCLPAGSGPQIAAFAPAGVLVYAERRCNASGSFSGSRRQVTPASLYNVNAYAVAHDPITNTIVATERAGFLTVYKVPRPAVAK